MQEKGHFSQAYTQLRAPACGVSTFTIPNGLFLVSNGNLRARLQHPWNLSLTL